MTGIFSRGIPAITVAIFCLIPAVPRPLAAGLPPAGTVREPAVAGLFYPAEPSALAAQIDDLLAAAPRRSPGDVRALICPHAGYRYSGPTAAIGYRTVAGRKFATVVLLAPSHYAAFSGASVARGTAFRTPLGLVPVARRAGALATRPPFHSEIPCPVERPGWWRESSLRAPPDGETPHTWEHSGEVHLPFLQRTLGRFELVPVVLGDCDPAAAAAALAPEIADDTLVVASTDLSHFHPYDEAKALDRACVDAICAMDSAAVRDCEACGKTPVLVLMELAKRKGWHPVLLDYRNSGDTAGDKSRVVGYAAVAFCAAGSPATATPAPASAPPPTGGELPAGERRSLLQLARRTIVAAAAHRPPPEPAADELPPPFLARRACFVTLTEHGELRGCIGHLTAQAPLYRAVIENAVAAATKDPRFLPVTPEEVGGLGIEISLLTEPAPLPFGSPAELLAKLRPGRDGVILRIGDRSATFLPQVWEQLPDKEQFLAALCRKAGADPNAWRNPGTEVAIYRVEAFHEEAGP